MTNTVNAANIAAIRSAYESREARVAGSPAVYVVEMTNRCNVNCVMCPQDEIPLSRHLDLDLGAARQIAQQIAPYAELVMLYFMGEPTLNEQMDQIIGTFRSHTRAKLVVSTNAANLTDDQMRALSDGRLDLLIACVDRWDRSAYEKIRRGASFDNVVDNIEQLAQRCASSSTELLVKALDIKMSPDEQEAFLAHWRQRNANALVGWLDTWAGHMPGLAKLNRSQPAPYGAADRVACADLWFKMVINVHGEVVLCCHDWASTEVVGSLTGPETLQSLWNSPRLIELRQGHLDHRFGCSRLCAGCREWGEMPELDAYLSTDLDQYFLVF